MSPKEIQKRNAKDENLRVLQEDDGSFYVEREKGKIDDESFGWKIQDKEYK